MLVSVFSTKMSTATHLIPALVFHKLAGLCRGTGLDHDNHRHEELV